MLFLRDNNHTFTFVKRRFLFFWWNDRIAEYLWFRGPRGRFGTARIAGRFAFGLFAGWLRILLGLCILPSFSSVIGDVPAGSLEVEGTLGDEFVQTTFAVAAFFQRFVGKGLQNLLYLSAFAAFVFVQWHWVPSSWVVFNQPITGNSYPRFCQVVLAIFPA